MANPFFTYAGVLERSTHLVHLYTPNQPEVLGYQFWGQQTLNDAYGNPVASGVGGAGAEAQFVVDRGDFFRSPTLRRKGLAAIPSSRRGTTQAAFDPDDFLRVGGVMPPDDQWLYLRVQERRAGVGLLEVPGPFPVLGPIYLVPPPSAYGMSAPAFALQGTAPSAVGCVAGQAPSFDEDLTTAAPRPMYLVFPAPLREFTLRNLGATDMLVAFGPGQTMATLLAGADMQLYNGMTKEMILTCSGVGGCDFSLHGVLSRG